MTETSCHCFSVCLQSDPTSTADNLRRVNPVYRMLLGWLPASNIRDRVRHGLTGTFARTVWTLSNIVQNVNSLSSWRLRLVFDLVLLSLLLMYRLSWQLQVLQNAFQAIRLRSASAPSPGSLDTVLYRVETGGQGWWGPKSRARIIAFARILPYDSALYRFL